jgi:hypothetical protein
VSVQRSRNSPIHGTPYRCRIALAIRSDVGGPLLAKTTSGRRCFSRRCAAANPKGNQPIASSGNAASVRYASIRRNATVYCVCVAGALSNSATTPDRWRRKRVASVWGRLTSTHRVAIVRSEGKSTSRSGAYGRLRAVTTHTSCPNRCRYVAVFPARTEAMMLYGGKK